MTNEEAIERIKTALDMDDIEGHCYILTKDADRKAFYLAIKALEQQPKTGHWKEHDTTFGRNIYYCTACGRSIEILYKYDFCPNCGAKMKVEE